MLGFKGPGAWVGGTRPAGSASFEKFARLARIVDEGRAVRHRSPARPCFLHLLKQDPWGPPRALHRTERAIAGALTAGRGPGACLFLPLRNQGGGRAG